MPADLYRIGSETVVASFEAYARGARDAAVIRAPGVSAAVFPHPPERAVYNNAVLDPGAGAEALDAMEAAYASAGVDRFAAWVHESDEAMRAEIAARGYTLDTATRAMGMALDDLRVPLPELELDLPEWPAYLAWLESIGVPPGLLAGADPREFQLLIARGAVAAALAFDHGDDCGIYNVGTLEHARRRGLGTALTARLLHDARARGRRTASLQATAMAEGLYAALGFRDLGRILEFTRPPRPCCVRRPPSSRRAGGRG
jgi:ribosomal protein S18 acetylase RimI-like enzyme